MHSTHTHIHLLRKQTLDAWHFDVINWFDSIKTFIIFRITIHFNGTNLGQSGYDFFKLTSYAHQGCICQKYCKNMDIVNYYVT